MMFLITCDSLPHSLHKEEEEAESYLEELKKHSPYSDYTIEEMKIGRDPLHTQLVWGSVGVWDLKDNILRNHRHKWMWPNEADEPFPQLRSGEVRSRFVPIWNREGMEVKLTKMLRKHFEQWKCVPDNDPALNMVKVS
jgi:hypothetical protein